jgi:hypothetical protein
LQKIATATNFERWRGRTTLPCPAPYGVELVSSDAKPTINQTRKADLRQPILDYLNYYCDKENDFDYAVMIKGQWGAGKTFFINKFIEARRASGLNKILYVSLYGVSSIRQIDEALYRQLHPVLSSKGMKLAAKIGKSLLKTTVKLDLDDHHDSLSMAPTVPDVDLVEYFKTPKECLLVFDDLERCSMPIADVLGYINSFVEHEGFKAIIVANEDEILKRPDDRYNEIKEKLIGQTLTIHSDINNVLGTFLALIKHDPTRAYLLKHVDDINLIYTQSATGNLRLLKHALWDFGRLGKCLTDEHWKNPESIGMLLKHILALAFEVRAGRITEKQLLNIQLNYSMRLFKEQSDTLTVEDNLKARYPEIEFSHQIVESAMVEVTAVRWLS